MLNIGALIGFFLLSSATMTTLAPASVPAAPTLPSYPVTLTAYNAVLEQTDDDPLVTASGAFSNPDIIAARSQDLLEELPFGTIIEIDGPAVHGNSCGYNIVEPIIGYRVIADTMNARYTDRIDILFDTDSNYILADGRVKNASTILGICSGATIRVVGHIDLSHLNHLPKTQSELAALVNGTSKTLALNK
jgi:3D (Asp-Asp-Asp) domain-containing protein